jgi:hypothetical protein
MVYLIIYLIGCLISFGITTDLQYGIDIRYVKQLQPTYQKPWHNPLTMATLWFSWLGVIVFGIVELNVYGRLGLKYSFKPLWDAYFNSNHK